MATNIIALAKPQGSDSSPEAQLKSVSDTTRHPVLLEKNTVEQIFNRPAPYKPTFNGRLFSILKTERQNLDEDYFVILDLIRQKKNFNLRPKFMQFRGVLERYLARTSIELYAYLRLVYAHDPVSEAKIAKAEKATHQSIIITAKFLKAYSSPSTIYGEKFDHDIRAIWVVLKLRYREEAALLYPMYRPI
ncbi:MAG: hypothetical protein AAF402_09700 [Pseudomonadota bacterium]